ncbi:MAG: flagellar basal-body MS-ring/collar protein FliF [Pseudomonadota bacterium]|uniref:Flagellar M-ring protein n=1 Tax=Gallaecimonas pentaromativorans TaxID=584787 RepID=A0A3N1PBC4_9GAMM|nr:flagellar basal-body MS-ring/collar protein FliF [Gallaecimonas pentaromativorans]MED5526525.1 flagellar basal-body MS-ring/collar protein FliF [Pseudomonadota bacterium]ROQ25863.1 flagellar M-ring protein FliF [Gallaecimonas pentaromativorans]
MAELINAAPGGFTLNSGFKSIAGRWRRLSGDSRSVLVIALLAAIVAAAIVVMLWTSTRHYVPLYGKQELYDKATIIDTLEKENIDFRLDGSSGNVLVPEDRLADARMRLAAKGVKASLPAGFDELNNMSTLGTSQFMESARYLHALEGELARTIIALDQVRSARVHLAVPKRTLFVGREEQKPSAAVMVDLASPLTPSQVEAIINLVSGSVPGMSTGAVSVVDQKGELLSAGIGDMNDPARLSGKQMDYTSKLEDRMTQRASSMLQPLLGSDNFRVEVAADVDFSSVNETREDLNANPVVTRETSKKDNSTDSVALGIPGALSNRPPVPANQANGQNNQNDPQKAVSQREETSRTFETGRAVTHTKYAEGRLSHLSVSVLLNSAKAPEGGWTQSDLDKLTQMVKTAVGFDDKRGDQFSLNSFSFAPAPAPIQMPELKWWQDPMWQDYIRYAVGGLMVLLLVLFGVRPLVRHLVRPQASVDKSAATAEALALAEQAAQAESRQGELEEDDENAMLATLPPPGSEWDVQLKHLQLLVDKETVRVAEVVKQWVSNNEQHHEPA